MDGQTGARIDPRGQWGGGGLHVAGGPLTRLPGRPPPVDWLWTGRSDRSPPCTRGRGGRMGEAGREGAVTVAGPLPDGQHLLSRQFRLLHGGRGPWASRQAGGETGDGVSHALGTPAAGRAARGPAWQRGHQLGCRQARWGPQSSGWSGAQGHGMAGPRSGHRAPGRQTSTFRPRPPLRVSGTLTEKPPSLKTSLQKVSNPHKGWLQNVPK